MMVVVEIEDDIILVVSWMMVEYHPRLMEVFPFLTGVGGTITVTLDVGNLIFPLVENPT